MEEVEGAEGVEEVEGAEGVEEVEEAEGVGGDGKELSNC